MSRLRLKFDHKSFTKTVLAVITYIYGDTTFIFMGGGGGGGGGSGREGGRDRERER